MEQLAFTRREVPVDLLYSKKNLVSPRAPDAVHFEHLALAPITNITPYMDAFEVIRSGVGSLRDFHSFEKNRTISEPYDELAGEKRLRRVMSRLNSFYSVGQPMIDNIDHDRLIVSEGLLQACAAKFCSQEWIKVSMPAHIATGWDARPTAELDQVCQQQGRKQIYTPIMHPAYRKYTYSRRGFRRLDMIRKHLGAEVQGMTLLDIGCNCGYYVFHLHRQGMHVTGIDMDQGHLAVANAQKSMYNANVQLLNVKLQDFDFGHSYDVVFAMSVFWHMLGWGGLPKSVTEQQLVDIIERIVGNLLFWESGPEPQREIALITENTRLENFTQLGTTSATGVDGRVFGVFSRVASP